VIIPPNGVMLHVIYLYYMPLVTELRIELTIDGRCRTTENSTIPSALPHGLSWTNQGLDKKLLMLSPCL